MEKTLEEKKELAAQGKGLFPITSCNFRRVFYVPECVGQRAAAANGA